MSDSRFSSTVGIFRNFVAMFSLAFGALNPEYIYATDRTVAAKVVTIAVAAVSYLISGAIIGSILGVVAGGIRAMIQRGPYVSAAGRPFFRRPSGVGLIVGLILGGLNLVTNPQREVFAESVSACEAVQEDIKSAKSLGDQRRFQESYDLASKAISDSASCRDDEVRYDLAAAYFIRIVTADRMQKPYAADISKARTYLGTCAEDPASGSECNEMVAALARYEAQQYCLSSYEHSARSDGLIDKDKAQSASESAAAIRDAGRCKNTYAYAYRGIALVEHNAATYLQGNHDISEFREGHALLTRCISELRGSTDSADLFTACKSSLAAANTWLAKVGP